jgi:hypothetical protein
MARQARLSGHASAMDLLRTDPQLHESKPKQTTTSTVPGPATTPKVAKAKAPAPATSPTRTASQLERESPTYTRKPFGGPSVVVPAPATVPATTQPQLPPQPAPAVKRRPRTVKPPPFEPHSLEQLDALPFDTVLGLLHIREFVVRFGALIPLPSGGDGGGGGRGGRKGRKGGRKNQKGRRGVGKHSSPLLLPGFVMEDAMSFWETGKGGEDVLFGLLGLVNEEDLEGDKAEEVLKRARKESEAGHTTAWHSTEKLVELEGVRVVASKNLAMATEEAGGVGVKTRTGAGGAMVQDEKCKVLGSVIELALRGAKCRKDMNDVCVLLGVVLSVPKPDDWMLWWCRGWRGSVVLELSSVRKGRVGSRSFFPRSLGLGLDARLKVNRPTFQRPIRNGRKRKRHSGPRNRLSPPPCCRPRP